jgi:hypothetical protein
VDSNVVTPVLHGISIKVLQQLLDPISIAINYPRTTNVECCLSGLCGLPASCRHLSKIN